MGACWRHDTGHTIPFLRWGHVSEVSDNKTVTEYPPYLRWGHIGEVLDDESVTQYPPYLRWGHVGEVLDDESVTQYPPYLRWGHVGEVLDDETVVLFWFHWPIVNHHVTVAMTTAAMVNLPIHCNRNSNYCNHSCAGDCYPQLHTVTTHKTKQKTPPTTTT